jgi:hypothetical protein
VTAVNAIKMSSDGTIEGLAIPFGAADRRDLDGEFFSKSTDFCLDWFDVRPVLFDHALDDSLKTAVVGRVTEHEMTDDGVWVRAKLQARRDYQRAIAKLVDEGALSFSSGAMPHLVQKDTKSGEIKRWPWIELSLTPTPANPQAAVYAVKAVDMAAHIAALEGDKPLAGESYADHYDRVLDGVADFIERSHGLVQVRAKSGRVLSTSNRERLATLRDRIAESVERGQEVIGDLDDLLKSTDPDAQQKAVALMREMVIREARLMGVSV